MTPDTHVVSLAPKSIASVPRAVWFAGGLLALVSAAVAGALVMRSVQPGAASPVPAPVAMASVPAASAAGQPVPLIAAATPPSHVAPSASAKPVPAPTRVAHCATCGVVESVNAVQQKGQGTGLGAVAGGVLGGVAGHQVGGGNGKTAMTVLGAIGGGLAGNEVEKRVRSTTLFDVRVRMEDGTVHTFQRAQSLAVGTHVIVEGKTVRASTSTGGDT